LNEFMSFCFSLWEVGLKNQLYFRLGSLGGSVDCLFRNDTRVGVVVVESSYVVHLHL
jgi:hypothetical protein